MRKGLIIVAVCFFTLTSCGKIPTVNKNINYQSLPNFIIGEWTAVVQTTDIHGSYEQEYYVEFVDSDTVTLIMRAPYGGINTSFDYKFIEENVLLVENERLKDGRWFINQVEEDLNICIGSNENCIRFERVG